MTPTDKIKTIGITGAAGILGTTLRKQLASKYTLKLYDVKEINSPLEGEFIQIDLSEQKAINGIFNGLDALIHLAGDPRPNAPTHLTYKNNFVATSYVFEEALRAGIKKVVYASSVFYHEFSIVDALQGALGYPITLDMPPTPGCLYAESKLFGEKVGLHLANLGVQFVALRIGWSVPENDPNSYDSPYMRAMFCSQRDLCQAFEKAIEIDNDYLVAFVISDNDHKIVDLEETKNSLDFHPQDNASDYFNKEE